MAGEIQVSYLRQSENRLCSRRHRPSSSAPAFSCKDLVMKKALQRTVFTAACLLLASSNQSHAIQGLKLSLQCSNVVLSWPCLDDGSETFIVQYRRTLDPNTPWQILTSSLYSQSGTDMTYFVHENVVTNADCGGDSLAAMESRDSSSRELTYFDWGVPLATPADGTGSGQWISSTTGGLVMVEYVCIAHWASGEKSYVCQPGCAAGDRRSDVPPLRRAR